MGRTKLKFINPCNENKCYHRVVTTNECDEQIEIILLTFWTERYHQHISVQHKIKI